MVAHLAASTEYQYGFHDDNTPVFKAKRGLSRAVVEEISDMKNEPDWMRKFRLRALEMFERRPLPNWGIPALADLDFDNIYYYLKPRRGSWRVSAPSTSPRSSTTTSARTWRSKASSSAAPMRLSISTPS
jgi:hypothetical protein